MFAVHLNNITKLIQEKDEIVVVKANSTLAVLFCYTLHQSVEVRHSALIFVLNVHMRILHGF